MAKRAQRFTVFDVMEARGDFDNNVANAQSPEFSGPQPYPQMFYHPEGRERVLKPAEVIMTYEGPKKVGELREIIWKIANDKAEANALIADGWHSKPADAIRANGGQAPASSAAETIARLEAELAELRAERRATAIGEGGILPQKLEASAAPLSRSKQ